ncbi:hypothetical protein V494_01384 [Pseudogymnoascus sp. VKM F-4513 (FW-928)]|nr:hypothetical protein V494_01384 [Pseudogymnoascus sp. VKM F-4513 (FW-928)]
MIVHDDSQTACYLAASRNPQPFLFNTTTMEEKPDGTIPYEAELPLPPTYEKAREIQEFDASGQLVTTLRVLQEPRRRLIKDDASSNGDSSLLADGFIAEYPESRFDVSVPTRSHSWMKSFMEVFLPAGYPNSVTEDYME